MIDMMTSKKAIELEDKYGAHNYTLPVVLSEEKAFMCRMLKERNI
jgi:hypothetical protein